MAHPEIEVLSEQLDELVASGVDDPDEALEIAALAGMLERLGADPALLAEALAWATDDGQAVLEEAWQIVDVEAFVEAIDACTGGDATEEEVEEAVLDFDELVAAATWCKKASLVKAAVRDVEAAIRMVPEAFAELASYGHALAALPNVASQLDLYGFWLAIADAGAYAEE